MSTHITIQVLPLGSLFSKTHIKVCLSVGLTCLLSLTLVRHWLWEAGDICEAWQTG